MSRRGRGRMRANQPLRCLRCLRCPKWLRDGDTGLLCASCRRDDERAGAEQPRPAGVEQQRVARNVQTP